MAIIGLGTDIVEIDRIEQSLQRTALLAKRILTPDELVVYTTHKFPARYLAKRFAAKEAAAKALGTGISQGVSFQHMDISNDVNGKPQLVFSGYTAELAEKLGVTHIWLSLTDEQAYAGATVILEQQ